MNALKQVVFQWTINEMRHELDLKHWVRLENEVQKVRLENEVQKLRLENEVQPKLDLKMRYNLS